jgi:hypothetical protein
MGFALSTFVEALLIALIVVFFIVNGMKLSWSVFVLFLLAAFGLLGWLRDAFYLFGVMEQTFQKDVERYKELFPKLHHKFVMRLMKEDIETVLKEQEEAINAMKKKVLQSGPINGDENKDGNSGS